MSESNKKDNERQEYQPVAGEPIPADYRPPSHEETLGALPGAPKDVAEEYSRTGRTPQNYVREIQKTEESARQAGLKANPGTAGQSRFHEDQERDAKEQQKQAERQQKQSESDARPQPNARRPQ